MSFAKQYFSFFGRDLSGTLDGAGGVCGLLATEVGGTWYFPLYDNNGNVTDYVSETGEVVASYSYDAFGRTLSATGSMASVFPFRFSTKYYDAETGLYYYGYRYYSPELGRWITRDPIEEDGGDNLYAFCGNNGILFHDALGKEFGITYVRFEGWLGHAWIRLGDKQTYDITELIQNPLQINGERRFVKKATAVLPVGIGFYPRDVVTKITSLAIHSGQWRYENQKELLAIDYPLIKEWDTERVRTVSSGGRQRVVRNKKIEYGDSKGSCCKNVTSSDVISCLYDYAKTHPRQAYWLPFLNCRSRAKSALKACCLKVGKRKEKADIGEIRLDFVP